jgi:SynChlorMet cassette radical SAM/SPASM protein ScmE
MKVMKTPRSVDLAVTSQCNLRCTYCSHFSSAGDVGHDLPAAEWLTFFYELGKCTVMDVTLQGAEPFFRKDLKEIIQGIVTNRMRFNILSNGTLITNEMAAFLASTKRCDGVQVSIDGSNSITHDVCRGDGSFVRALNGIGILRKFGIPVNVRVTIHKYNVHDIDALARLLLEEMGLSGFSTNSASFMGLCRYNEQDVQLTIEERCYAMETLLRLNEKYDGRISANAGPLADARSWLEMEQARRDGQQSMHGQGYLSGCSGPLSKIAVRADGVIIPCIQMSHIELGRINKDDLTEIWQNHSELRRLRERSIIPLSSFEFCKDCPYINYCTGNCPALAYTIVGNAEHPSPDACLKRFIEAGGKLPK